MINKVLNFSWAFIKVWIIGKWKRGVARTYGLDALSWIEESFTPSLQIYENFRAVVGRIVVFRKLQRAGYSNEYSD